MPRILEISSRSSKGGRRKIKMALLTIHSDKDTNLNGLHWDEKYVENNIESAKGMPICASFIDDEKIYPVDHGYTETVETSDGKQEPLFGDSECCGVIEDAKIEDVEIDGEQKKVLCGYGYLFEQRYFNFVNYVRKQVELSSIKTSIEIVGKDHNPIIYDGGYDPNYRIPEYFDFSGVAILGCGTKEADANCYVLEVASKKEGGNLDMNENEIKDLIRNTITEVSDKNAEMGTKIEELNQCVTEKDAKIEELNQQAEVDKAAIAEKDAKIEELNQQIENLTAEVNECKKANATAELNKKLECFSDNEKKFAESEINSFNEDPLNGDVDAIVSKIYAAIGKASKEIAEQNAAQNQSEITDIFSDVNDADDNDDAEDCNIF